jgi:hypothetical protein
MAFGLAMKALLAAVMLWIALPAGAQVPIPLIFVPTAVPGFTSSGVGVAGTTQTVTITFNPNNQTAFAGQLQTLGFQGANAADFLIVPGGTCVIGSTVLAPITSTTGQSCTVNVRYTPSTAGAESALMTATCVPVALVGGFAVSCNSVLGDLTSLAGSILAPVAANIPTLSPASLGVVALLLFAAGAFASLRRR